MNKNQNIRYLFLGIGTSLLLIIGVYIFSLTQVKLGGLDIDQIQDVDLEGFTLEGDLNVYNGGIVPISISYVEYNVTLEGVELAKGEVDGAKVRPKETISFPISSRISWAPTTDAALGLLEPGDTYVLLSGRAHIGFLSIPFSKEVNIEGYVRQFVVGKIKGFLGGGLVEGVLGIVG